MKASELLEALRYASPDAEVVSCLGIPDGVGDYLLFSEAPASGAGPCPGDGSGFLVRATIMLGDLAAQACDPSVIRSLARALEREADSMDEHDAGRGLGDAGL